MVTWIDALAKTRSRLSHAFTRVFKRADGFSEAALEEFEETLLTADVSMRLVMEWTEALRKGYKGLEVDHREVIRGLLTQSLEATPPFTWPSTPRPYTILLVGVNGTGKTTSAAKLAWRAQAAKLKPILAATDTFRAAGADQLRIWADRVGCEVVAGQQGSDAAAVAFDAIAAAQARSADTVIIDTAGRMHTKQPLMNELQKVRRAIESKLQRAPDETWIVLDAAMGQNALTQARQFHQTAPLSGVVVTKLDGSAKAGFLFSVVKELQVPIRFVGLGEGMEDLTPFDRDAFVNGLLGNE
jgi:fused signal recognition particle receptor